jgi:hypothetical protein
MCPPAAPDCHFSPFPACPISHHISHRSAMPAASVLCQLVSIWHIPHFSVACDAVLASHLHSAVTQRWPLTASPPRPTPLNACTNAGMPRQDASTPSVRSAAGCVCRPPALLHQDVTLNCHIERICRERSGSRAGTVLYSQKSLCGRAPPPAQGPLSVHLPRPSRRALPRAAMQRSVLFLMGVNGADCAAVVASTRMNCYVQVLVSSYLCQ